MYNLDARATSVYVTEDLDVEAARAFVPPPFLGEEKTESGDFSMSAYWHATRGSGREG